jgi:tetratricopeptide (TPR) repeat protein
MPSPRPRVLNDFPYPVAYPYSLTFDESDRPSNRRWALCFTEYQLLRMACLPLVSQYLREPIDETAQDAIAALNRAVASIRSPFFSDWITLLHTLRKHLPRVGLVPLFPRLGDALDALKEPAERPVGLRGNRRLDALAAILALRNGTAHGGLPDQDEARRHLDEYLPVLHQVLDAFDFLGDGSLRVCRAEPDFIAAGRAPVVTLRGHSAAAADEEELDDALAAAFTESPAVLVVPPPLAPVLRGEGKGVRGGSPSAPSPPTPRPRSGGEGGESKVMPLYPLLNPVSEQEPLFLYDGHYGIRVQTKQAAEERSYVYYLGAHHRVTDGPACDRLKALLARRQISFFLDKENTAPWSIADSAADYSRRTLEELRGTKYFPECYLPFGDLERHFDAFLGVPEPRAWAADTARRRHVNGFLLIGPAGAGKTAFLARQVERLLGPSAGDEAGRESRNLVLFLRGNGIALRPEGMSLFRDVAEKLGIAVDGATAKARSSGGFSSFRELFDHLHARWKQDRVPGRRLVLVLDALNEAPFAETVVREGLGLIGAAACYPWCKVIISTRQEWLSVWGGKLGPNEASPLEELRPFLYVFDPGERREQKAPPVVLMEPFTEAQAGDVYGRYQAARGDDSSPLAPVLGGEGSSGGYRIASCRTAWAELPATTRDLLLNPLYLHLFMETFDGRSAEPVLTVPSLFRQYVERALRERPGLGASVEAVVGHLLGDLTRPSADLTDDDCNAIRRAWAEGRSAEEARLELSPVEGLAHEGLVTKRVREEGGGYRFVFQTVAEYLLYRHFVAAKPPAEDEGACWGRLARPAKVFGEYSGAFAFLFRAWAAGGQLRRAGPLVEGAPPWLGEVMTAFVVEQARTGHLAGRGSATAEEAVRALAAGGGKRTADRLLEAGDHLRQTRWGLTGLVCYRECASALQALSHSQPEDAAVAAGLAAALRNLAVLLRDVGRLGEAEEAHRRAADIAEALHRRQPADLAIAEDLMTGFNNLGLLLNGAGRRGEAEAAFRRAADVGEAIGAGQPDAGPLTFVLATALGNLAFLLGGMGRVGEAEATYARALSLFEGLRQRQPENVPAAQGFAMALNNLGLLLGGAGRLGEAEAAFRRAAELYEAMCRQQPESIYLPVARARALANLAFLRQCLGRPGEAEATYGQAAALYEESLRRQAENVPAKEGFASALNNLGLLLGGLGRAAEGRAAFRRAADLYEALHRLQPDNVAFLLGYASSLCNVGRTAEAEPLVDAVLARVPWEPLANRLKRFIEHQRR